MEEKNDSKKCSRYYLYILITSLFFLLKSSILDLSELCLNVPKSIFGVEVVIKNHILMKLFLEYSGYIIYGGISLIIFRKKIFKENVDKNKLLLGNTKFFTKKNWKTIRMLLIACCFFGIQLIVRNILNFFSIWMLDIFVFNIIFINYFMRYFLNTPIYKHQLYALIFNFSISLILLISASAIKYEGVSDFDNVNAIYGNYSYILLFYLIYMILSALLSLSQVLQKKLMDFNFISPFTILFVIGLINILFIFIAILITTNESCGENLTKNNTCPISYQGYKNGDYFFDNFYIYISNMSDRLKSDKTSFYLEILLIYPLYSLAWFIKNYYEALIVLYLNPNFVLISDNIYYSIRKILLIISIPTDIRTYLRLFGEVILIIGYFLYLEIIVLKCFGLNINIKNKITERGFREINLIDINLIREDDEESSRSQESKQTEMINSGDNSTSV